jgi:hypothetical protein
VLYYIFDDYDDEWKNKRSALYQVIDVITEVMIVILASFWLSYYMHTLPLLISVAPAQEVFINAYTIDVFFTFAVFIFLDNLTGKLQYVHEEYLSKHVNPFLPQYGSLVDMTLSYTRPKSGASMSR